MTRATPPSTTVLTLRRIGNSQGVVLPKALLAGLDFSRGILAEKVGDELRLKPAMRIDDPFGFGTAADKMIADSAVDPLLAHCGSPL
ncbi:AbrB/MazE/SpoVT family DNA-binding domain-containing protein [Bordetella genomosp. 13]|uniref:AbrB/MazE/SpoVT family DNA-binding domain-containing protein n=1 Tax=Bordetella genomosp. 13 TaxID=463040 RepID=UPI0012FBC3C0|nr:hypothetical protein [Bordetella genomosp. 13]